MIAPEYFNNHIAVEGEIIVKRVPNDTGSVLVWNSTTKKISTRTHAEIIADLSLMTTNTNQNVTGLKSFITSGGNYAPFNNSLQIYSDDGSNPSMTYSKGGAYVGQTMFDETGFHFKNGDNNAYYNVRAKGFIKENGDNTSVLLDGGGSKPISEFVSTNHRHTSLENNQNNDTVDSHTLLEDNKFKFVHRISAGSSNLFPTSNNANSIVAIATHPGGYGSLLGINSDNEYFSKHISAGNYSPTWRQFAFRDWVSSQLSSYVNQSQLDNRIPYTGANQNPDFNGKNLGGINRLTTNSSIKHNGLGLSLVNISGSGGYSSVLIKTGMVSGNMGTFTVKLYRYAHEYFEFNVNNYKYNNSNYATNITWKAGNSNAITRIEFLKDSSNILYVNVVMDMAYPRLAVTDLMAYGWDDAPFDSSNWGAEWNGDTSTLINEGQALSANFLRDNYLDDIYLSAVQPYWKRFDFGSFSAVKTDKAFGILAEAGNAQKLLTNGLYIGENYNDQGLIPTNGIYSKGLIDSPEGVASIIYSGHGNPNIRKNPALFSFWGNPMGAIVIELPTASGYQAYYKLKVLNAQWNAQAQHLEIQSYIGGSGYSNVLLTNDTGDADIISNVRLGTMPNGNDCIVLNNVDTAWGYPAIIVDEYIGGSAETAKGEWNSHLVTDLTSYTLYTQTVKVALNKAFMLGTLVDYATVNQLNNKVSKSGDTMTGGLNIYSNGNLGRWKGADNNTNYLIWRNYPDTKDIAYIGADGNSAAGGGVGDGFAIVAPSGSLQLTASTGVYINGNLPWTQGHFSQSNVDYLIYMTNTGMATQSDLLNYIPNSQKAQPNGVATLDGSGQVPATQLPSYVDDVLEFSSLGNFPATGETGKIYVRTDTDQTYRWSGSTYIQIASGAVQSVNGQVGIVNLTKSDIGLGNVDNTADSVKEVSYALNTSKLYSTDTSYGYHGVAPYFGFLSYKSSVGRWRFEMSPATPASIEVAHSDNSDSFSGLSLSSFFKNNEDNTLKTIDASNYNDVVDGNGKMWLGNFYSLSSATTGFISDIGTILNINGLVAHDKTQLIFNGGNGSIQYRTSWYANTPWSPVRTLWDSNNLVNPWGSNNLSPVTIDTPQTIIADKSFANSSLVRFLGGENNHVSVVKEGTATNTIVSGFTYSFYDTMWKVGNKRGSGADSLGYSFEFSGNNGLSYQDPSVLIQADGNILSSNFGSANLWNQAYNWGNHAGAGYATQSWVINNIPSYSFLAQNYALRAGSNATDTWVNSSFGLSSNPAIEGRTMNALGTVYLNAATYGQIAGYINTYGTDSGNPTNEWFHRIKMLHNNSAGYYGEIAVQMTGANGLYFKRMEAGTDYGWVQAWDKENLPQAKLNQWDLAYNYTLSDVQFITDGTGDITRYYRNNASAFERLKIGIGIVDTRVVGNGLGSDGSDTFLPNSGISALNHKMVPLFHYVANKGWCSSLTLKGWTDAYKAWKITGPADNSDVEQDFYLSQTQSSTGAWMSDRLIWTDKYFSYTNILQWNDIYTYGIRTNVEFTTILNTGLVLADNYYGQDTGLVDGSQERFVAGKLAGQSYYFFGSNIGYYDGLNYNYDAKIITIGKETTNDEDKVQIAGNISVDAVYYGSSSADLILNPLYNESGDIRDSRNAHIYVVTRNNVRLPVKPILGQRIEIFNNSKNDIEVMHDNVGTLFYLPGFGKITGIAGGKGFIFDEKPIPAKHYGI